MGSLNTAKVAKHGIDLNDEVRKKLSEATKLAWKEGRRKGKRHSAETRAKMSKSRKLAWDRKKNAATS